MSRLLAIPALLLISDSRSGLAPPLDREADALQQQGIALLAESRSADAGRALRDALRRHQAAGDHAQASVDAGLIARSHWLVSELRDALRMAELARAEAVASGDKALLASALMKLGNGLQNVGEYESALGVFEEAELHLPADDVANRARLRNFVGISYHSTHRLAEAEAEFEGARDLARDARAPELVESACANLASVALAEHRLDDAERALAEAKAAMSSARDERIPHGILLNQAVLERQRGDLVAARAALEQAARSAPPETASLIALERGKIAELARDHGEAVKRYREAMTIVERMRQTFAPTEAKASFFEDQWSSYGSLFALQLRLDDPAGAFATLVLAQGRIFLEVLAASLAETTGSSASRIGGAIDRIDTLERVSEPLSSSYLRKALSPDATLAALRGRHVVAYFAAGDRLRLMLLADGRPRAMPVDIERRRLEKLVDDFRARPDDERAAEELGRAILPPGALPPHPARIDVVPTGPLLQVPFAALRVAGARLVDRYEIAYAPSVTGLAMMTGGRNPGAGPGVVIADTRSDLRHAAGETDEVIRATGASPKIGEAATRAALRAAADSPHLHVISHSGLASSGGYLELADGTVSAADILSWRIRPRLVVLPTCGSAATHRSEMWDSLAAAFLASGSVHVVATLSSVEDHVASEFTRAFYRLGGMRDPVGAVTRAQRALIGRIPVAAWSAFVVLGP